MELSSLKVIVTGAARGMGAHLAAQLAEAGASVTAADVDGEGLAPGRIGLPEDLCLAVKFIIECDDFNGRTVDVDGGLVT